MSAVEFLRAELVEPARLSPSSYSPRWLVRVRIAVAGREAVVAYRFDDERAARDWLEIAEAAPEAVAAHAADMLTQEPAE